MAADPVLARIAALNVASQDSTERGDAAEGLRHADMAFALAAERADERSAAWALVRRAAALIDLDRLAEAGDASTEATGRFTRTDDPLGIARSLSVTALAAVSIGEVPTGFAAAAETMVVMGRIRLPSLDLAATHGDLGAFFSALGDDEAAIDHAHRAVDIVRELGAQREALRYQGQLVAATAGAARQQRQADRGNEARTLASGGFEMAEDALSDARTLGEDRHAMVIQVHLAELLIEMGRPSAALPHLDGLLDVPALQTDRAVVARVHIATGIALRQRNNEAESSAALESGLGIARKAGAVRLEADAHFERSLMFEASGRFERALDELRSFHRLGAGLRRHATRPQHSVMDLRSGLSESNGASRRMERRIGELAELVGDMYQRGRDVVREALTDPLTGLPNRRSLDQRVAERAARPELDRPILWVAMIDVDGFKQINDGFGHAVGDHVLETLGDLMKRQFRESDIAARFGGDEFVLLFESTDANVVLLACERFRAAVDERDWASVQRGLRVTLSIGIAGPARPSETVLLLGAADGALYEAKRAGRNCVVMRPPTDPVR